MRTLFSNTEQRVHILADGYPLGLYMQLHTVPIYLGGYTPLLYIRGYTPLLFICTPAHRPTALQGRKRSRRAERQATPAHPALKRYKSNKVKGDRKMSFAKYFEDNMEIIEERFALRQQENEHTPIYRVTQEVGSKIYLVTTKVIEVKPEAPKKHKRKKKKIVCCDCGETFLFTGGEQKYYEERKLSEPKRCPACRQKRKELFKALKKNEEV